MGRSTMSQVNDEDAGALEERDEFNGQPEYVDEDDSDDDAEIASQDDAFDEDLDDYDEIEEMDSELSLKEQNARSLAIRRAIEQRMERKRLDEDLDYLDFDSDD